MGIFLLISTIFLSFIIAYLAYRLGYSFLLFFIISLIFSPILSILILTIWDIYKNYFSSDNISYKQVNETK